MTHDYKRNGTTTSDFACRNQTSISTLFAALNVLDGTVLGRCMGKHRHQEFITFLHAVDRAVPVGKVIHAILDNYATHKHPWVFHFTPTSASRLNAVEGFFSAITRRRIRRGVFRSVAELEDAIRRYIQNHNRQAKPFVWTKTAKQIRGKLNTLRAPSE